MTVGRLPYSCKNVYHPGKSCNAYALEKVIRSTINSLKITLIASLIPQIVKKRKHLFQTKDPKDFVRTVKIILIRYIRAALFLTIGIALPFISVCWYPLNSAALQSLPTAIRLSLIYGSFPILSLIVEVPAKMPGYMGFFVQKCISMTWQLFKNYKFIPSYVPFEK